MDGEYVFIARDSIPVTTLYTKARYLKLRNPNGDKNVMIVFFLTKYEETPLFCENSEIQCFRKLNALAQPSLTLEKICAMR